MFTSTNPSDIKEVIATVPEASANEILTALRPMLRYKPYPFLWLSI